MLFISCNLFSMFVPNILSYKRSNFWDLQRYQSEEVFFFFLPEINTKTFLKIFCAFVNSFGYFVQGTGTHSFCCSYNVKLHRLEYCGDSWYFWVHFEQPAALVITTLTLFILVENRFFQRLRLRILLEPLDLPLSRVPWESPRIWEN